MSKYKTKGKTKALFKTAAFACMSTALAAAADVMDGAAVSSPLTEDFRNCLVDNGYNNYTRQTTTASGVPGIEDGSTEFTIILAEPSTFATIFLNNSCLGDDMLKAFGEGQLLVGNDANPWSLTNTLVATIYDGGFFNIELELCEPA